MPIPRSQILSRRLIVARVKDEIFAFYAGENGTSQIKSAVAWELTLAYNVWNASITIEVGTKTVTIVMDVEIQSGLPR